MKKCTVEGCDNKHLAKGYCSKHYQQMKKCGHILEKTIFNANEIIEYEDYAEIILYNNKGEEVARALIDLEYVDLIKQYKWCLNNGYVYNYKVGRLHRFIMNPSDDLVIDHINHNRLDNRMHNLRICTQQQNSINKSKQSNNKSGMTGVCWCKDKNRWKTRIQTNGKIKHLGYYKTKEEAIEARKQAEIEYFGEYAPNIKD